MSVDRPAAPDLAELRRAIEEVNRRRIEQAEGAGAEAPSDPGPVEPSLEQRFAPSHRLAVYGTLAPGEVNHGEVAELRGEWHPGFVRGGLAPQGWGTTYGFPAFRWDPDGRPIPVLVLVSPDLPAHWPRLDAFEGPGYRRILVPVEDEAGALVTVANLYAGLPRAD